MSSKPKVRHSLDMSNAVTDANGDIFAFCKACNLSTKVVTYRELTPDGNVARVTFRCAHSRKKRGAPMPVVEHVDNSWSYDSLGDDIASWADVQEGCCLMCGKHARLNPKTKLRALFVVPVTATSVLRGVFCWDCRTLLSEFVTHRHQGLMERLVGLGVARILPPQ